MDKLNIPYFDRDLFGSKETFTKIGNGLIGGKASGLAYIKNKILIEIDKSKYPLIEFNIPTLTILTTDIFDRFMQINNLYEFIAEGNTDERIAHEFQKSEFPSEYVGDLRGLIEKVNTPLAIRSSSMLEDAINHPFAGVYGTKMIPNNQPDADTRFRKMVEAIKFVYASTFFKEAVDYLRVTNKTINDEKMAVIIQEIVGKRYDNIFYPNLSGVGRTFNFYPFGHAVPEDGVLVLALGLGKTIVDGGKTWSLSPRYPKQPPPYNSCQDIIKQTQSEFWAVNMGKPSEYNPLKETEYLVNKNIDQAEYDGTIKHLVSTYQANNDRIVIGYSNPGPRVIDFAPMIRLDEFSFVGAVENIMSICKDQIGSNIEIEFAATISDDDKMKIGLLQVREINVSDDTIKIEENEVSSPNLLLLSERVMGNGKIDNIFDIVYLKPESFDAKDTIKIAREIGDLNAKLSLTRNPYILIGFGRWGSSDPWLGIPVVWSQISYAKVLVEATLPDMDVDLSQGAHFFHNLTSFKIFSFSIHHSSDKKINFDWLNRQKPLYETEYIRHIRTEKSMLIKANSLQSIGVILYG